jgi:hypothetical protein
VSTPRKLRPGTVPPLEAWPDLHVPENIALPPWVDRSTFLPWLRDEFEKFTTSRTSKQLSKAARKHLDESVPWLKEAEEGILKGDFSYVRARDMPGHARAACALAADRDGKSFEALVAEAASADLLPILQRAILDVQKTVASVPQRKAGRPSMQDRNMLLEATALKLREYRIPESVGGTPARAPEWHEARAAADDILIGCGVPSASPAQNSGSLKRAGRRGKTARRDT